MRIRNSKKIWAGALCMTLFFANVLPAGLTASASEEQIPFETELQTNEENSEETAETDKSEEVLATEQPEETAISDTESAILEEESFEESTESVTPNESESTMQDIESDTKPEETQENTESKNSETENYEAKSTTKSNDESNHMSETEESETENYELEASNNIIAGGVIDEDYGHITWEIDQNGKLTVKGTGDFSASDKHDRAPWYENNKDIISAKVELTELTNASYMFYECRNLTDIDLSGCDTHKATTMKCMFSNCNNLTTIDLNHFNTYNVTDMSYMFSGCNNLISLSINNFDTSNVQNMETMFFSCENLTTLDISNFNTKNVTNMWGMFDRCSNLSSLDLSNFNTQNVTDMTFMFSFCKKLTNLNISSFDTSNVTSMQGMFEKCSSLTVLVLDNFDTSNVTSMSGIFSDCNSLTNLNLSNFDTSNVQYMSDMFRGCSGLQSLDLSNFDTSSATSMNGMFNGCSGLTDFDLNSFDLGKVTSTGSMFSGCSSLTSLNLSSFDTNSVLSMDSMFSECKNLTDLDLSHFDTSNVTSMMGMFNGCSNLTKLNLSSFITSEVESMYNMFSGCSNLTSLDLSHFDTSKVTNMEKMFSDCNNLTSLNLVHFNTSKVTDMGEIFKNCSSLTSLDLSSFDTSRITTYFYDMNDVFLGCDALSTIYTPINVRCSVVLPTTTGDTWYLSDGTVVTELPKNLSYSVELIKKPSDEQDPDDELKYVKSLTQNSLKNADDNTKKSINNALYNLIFKAEYRPIRSKIPGDTTTFTGTKETIMKWPIQNKDAFQSSVHDAILGDIKFSNSAAGCMAYTYFASSYIYTTCGSSKKYTNLNAESIKAKIHEYADPGEQIRYHTSSYPHSVVFVGESEDGEGFYYISYGGGEDKEHHKSHDLCMDYTSYRDLAALIGGRQFLIYDTNTGSYYNGNAKPLESVHTTNAQKIIKRIACPAEASVTQDGITLDSRHPGSVSFGTVERDGEDIVFTLDYSSDYELSITGTGEGTMTLTLEYYDNGNTMIDQRKFVDVPIKASTEIKASGSDSRANYILYIPDETGNTIAWGAGINETVNAPDDIFLSNDLSMPDESETAVFTINFDTNGGTADTTSMTTKTDGKLSELPSAKRDGYDFSGWYTSVDGGMKIDLNHVYTENTTLYAHWTLKKDDSDKDSDNTNTNDTDKETLYTVTFNMSGHGSDITRTNIKNDSLIIDKPDDPKTEGYTFTGWYKDSNCTVKWDFATDKVTSDTILYAGWAAKDSDTDQNDPFYTDAERISLKNAGAIANIKSRVYDGYEYEPAIKVTLTRNGKKTSLLEGADYTVTYKNNVNAGTATAVIKGCGMYKDDLTTNFSISRKSIKKLRVIAGSITGNTTGSSLSTLPVYIYDGSTLLEPSKDYTLSGYSTESQTAKVTVTGTGNYKDSRTVTFTLYADGTQNIIKPENIVLATKETSYTGNAISPEVKVTLNGITLTKNRDYKVQYQHQKNAGTAFAIITGKGAYKGKAIVPFQISAAKGTMIIKNIPAKTYNGKLQKPSITVTVPLNGKTVKLVQNKDYKISWKNNLRAGSNSAVAVVTGKGNYAGLTAEKKFTIKQQIISKAVISGTQGKLVLTYAGRILKEGLDYEKPVYEQGNKNKVKVIIKGKGSFKGETTKLVKIQ